MKTRVKYIDIKEFMPAVDIAIFEMVKEIERCTVEGVIALKVLHGYGSSGKGGLIKKEAGKVLQELKKQGSIKDFVRAENWNANTERMKTITGACPELILDEDINNGKNPGITVVILK